jgi:hypothetical protein
MQIARFSAGAQLLRPRPDWPMFLEPVLCLYTRGQPALILLNVVKQPGGADQPCRTLLAERLPFAGSIVDPAVDRLVGHFANDHRLRDGQQAAARYLLEAGEQIDQRLGVLVGALQIVRMNELVAEPRIFAAVERLHGMELAHSPYKKRTYEGYVGARALEEFGRKAWRKHVEDVVEYLVAALQPRGHRAGRRQRQNVEKNTAIMPAWG